MPYIKVTEELRKVIKEERKKRKITSNQLSEDINKGKAYISQIESGKINTIDSDVFYDIFKNIIKNVSEEEYNQFITNILDKTTLNFSKAEIEHQEWFLNFDLSARMFLITDNIVEFVNQMLDKLNISASDLIKKLNMNEGLEDITLYKENQLKVFGMNNGEMKYGIKFKLPEDLLSSILDKSTNKINYINMLGIIYNLYKLDGKSHHDAIKLSEIFLKENGFLTTAERKQKLDENEHIKIENKEPYKLSEIAPTQADKVYYELIEDIEKSLDAARTFDIPFTIDCLGKMKRNFNIGMKNILTIYSLQFDKINNIDKFIVDLEKLIDSYSKSTNQN